MSKIDDLFDKYLGSNGVVGSADLIPKNKQLKAELLELLKQAAPEKNTYVMIDGSANKYADGYNQAIKDYQREYKGVVPVTTRQQVEEVLDEKIRSILYVFRRGWQYEIEQAISRGDDDAPKAQEYTDEATQQILDIIKAERIDELKRFDFLINDKKLTVIGADRITKRIKELKGEVK